MNSLQFKPGRKSVLILLGLVMLAALASLVITLPSSGSGGFEQAKAQPIYKSLHLDQADTISVKTSDEDYTLTRTDDGWVMPEKANMPIDGVKIDRLFASLTSAQRTQAMTQLPERFDELGLGDPETGGYGAAVSLDTEDIVWIFGVKNGQQYARKQGETQTWKLDALLPPLHSPLWWLDASALSLPEITLPIRQLFVWVGDLRSDVSTAADRASFADIYAGLSVEDVKSVDAQFGTRLAVFQIAYGAFELQFSLVEDKSENWLVFGPSKSSTDVTSTAYLIDPLDASDLLSFAE